MVITPAVVVGWILLAVAFSALVLYQWYEYARTKKWRGNSGCHSCGDSPLEPLYLEEELVATVEPSERPGERKLSLSKSPETGNGERMRVRDLGLTPGILPSGTNNAITDVPGVKVGHTTLVSGEGALAVGEGPVRTGVTVIVPHSGDLMQQRVSAGACVLNGNGVVTGLDWVRENGFIEGPIALTNTHSVPDVYKAIIRWMNKRYPTLVRDSLSLLPVVGECDDSILNDINGFHVTAEHVFAALDSAASGPVAEGAVGAGTGMTCYRFKGGIGTASRMVTVTAGATPGTDLAESQRPPEPIAVTAEDLAGLDLQLPDLGKGFKLPESLGSGGGNRPVGSCWPNRRTAERPQADESQPPGSRENPARYTVGVLANCNHGLRDQLVMCGVPVGKILADEARSTIHREGSICIVVATDAPLSGRQLERLARRATMGLARTGSAANNSSGDFVVAFSTGRMLPRASDNPVMQLPELSDDYIDCLFQAVVEATEEAVLNALCMASTTVGRDGNVSPALPLARVRAVLSEYRHIK